jgi:enamine deaminase RidA (YjgF/YER057c/UK114 family)
LEAAGGTIDDIVKTHVTLADARLISAFDEEYAKAFAPPYPVRSMVVAGLAQAQRVVGIEATAVLGASRNAVMVTSPPG